MNGPKKLIGNLFELVIGAVVLAYLGLHTVNFFMFTFPAEQEYLAWLGFGLTGGALIGYLVIFLWAADTDLKKTVALLMVLVSGVGEILAAGFGMMIEGWAKLGWQMTPEEFSAMLLAIRILAFAHALALVVYIAGDKIGELLGDHDGDGTPNFLDSDYKPEPKKNKGSTFRFPWQKKAEPAPEPVRQFSLSADEIAELVRAEIAKSAVGQGSNGNGAADPTKAAR